MDAARLPEVFDFDGLVVRCFPAARASEFQRLPQSLAQAVNIVMRDSQPPRFATQLTHGIGENLSVGIVNPARLHLFAGRYDFVPCRKDRHHWPSPDLNLRHTDSGEHARVAAGQQLAPSKHRLARSNVGSGK